MEATTALIPSELLARYDALPFDGTYKRADDTLSTVFAEALAAVVNAVEDADAWEEHALNHPFFASVSDCCYCNNRPPAAIPSRFLIDN